MCISIDGNCNETEISPGDRGIPHALAVGVVKIEAVPSKQSGLVLMVKTPIPAYNLDHKDSRGNVIRRVELPNVSWQTYQALLNDLGDQRSSRLAYDQGILEIIMLSDRHESRTQISERFVTALTEELGLPAKGFRSTTLNRKDLSRGAEPDSCYYIQNVKHIKGRTLDLAVDPPPDLVIKVDVTSSSDRRLQIYQQLGVPEVWRQVETTVIIYQLQAGEYVACDRSPTFSIVTAETINQFLQRADTQDNTTLMRSWRQWVRGNDLD